MTDGTEFEKSIDRLIGAAWRGDAEAVDAELDDPCGALAEIKRRAERSEAVRERSESGDGSTPRSPTP